jgi:hypothetical protein
VTEAGGAGQQHLEAAIAICPRSAPSSRATAAAGERRNKRREGGVVGARGRARRTASEVTCRRSGVAGSAGQQRSRSRLRFSSETRSGHRSEIAVRIGYDRLAVNNNLSAARSKTPPQFLG